ncbi:hypothetical protein TNIN_129401 [Trichonephila inaurata madagascariensis]|uniref:Uncharacterized protein n=1 Tax=Trichonephila inaurata madagascariensis TaxID=2747483 RepID=A0A8X7BYW1_9ARAC|nr:hypothetical protein TNIN_129401 [Trichonephila inaurata madagascariensis]
MEPVSSLTNQADISRPLKHDFCFQAQSPQPNFLTSYDVNISPKKHNMLQSLSSFQTFDDLSDSPLNILQTFKKSIRIQFETPPMKRSDVLDLFEDYEEFAPFRFPPKVTGFTEEDDENHREPTERSYILSPHWMRHMKRKSSKNNLK